MQRRILTFSSLLRPRLFPVSQQTCLGTSPSRSKFVRVLAGDWKTMWVVGLPLTFTYFHHPTCSRYNELSQVEKGSPQDALPACGSMIITCK
mmetsp:Transcript_12524/g.23254  ORF Transcript_12524/g.23254 Transcript_12524/m.23254 type:complete len:92 (-) Transcript_12524:14-289(-)